MKVVIAFPRLGLVLLMNLVITNLLDPLCNLQTVADVFLSFLTATSNIIENISSSESGIHLGVISAIFHVQDLQCSL